MVYNVADHAEAFAEVGAQGISFTAGVPPVVAALLIAEGCGTWAPWSTSRSWTPGPLST